MSGIEPTTPTPDEPSADERETARLNEQARQNEEVRRLEHPEEFTDESAKPSADGAPDRTVAPVAPASTTGADSQTSSGSSVPPPAGSELDTADAEHPQADDGYLAWLERELARVKERLFGAPTL